MLEAIQNRDCGWFYDAKPDDFKKIPGSPVAYWASKEVLEAFNNNAALSSEIETREGLTTGNNDRFLRLWFEVNLTSIGFSIDSENEAQESQKRYFPCVKGGDFRRWYGNLEYVVNWFNDGEELKNFKDSSTGRVRSHNYNGKYAFHSGFSWSGISSGRFAVRYVPRGLMFDTKGPMGFSLSGTIQAKHEAFLNSEVANQLLKMLAPTLDFKLGHVLNLPVLESMPEEIVKLRNRAVDLAFDDWNESEIAWDFKCLLLEVSRNNKKIKDCLNAQKRRWQEKASELKSVEERSNQLLIDAYNLSGELVPDVPLEEVGLTCNPHYRYGGNRSEEELETLLQCDTLKELVSYSIGCMMGRYSLDKPGLILASQGETVRDYLAQISEPSFAPDDNAIIPLTDQEWFPDDATNRFRDFVRTVWGEEHLQENLDFVAESLCLHAIKPPSQKNGGEAALDTIRRYLSTQFFKDHLRTYKKRPIYWLFSSGKQKAFECLVYLHRYNESTLAEMRTDYVIPLTTKLASYVEKLEQDKEASTSAAEAKAIEKELSKLYKQQAELNTFDEKLRHYADQRISLDLDDGVKLNYGKFGDLLAEVKQVVGK